MLIFPLILFSATPYLIELSIVSFIVVNYLNLKNKSRHFLNLYYVIWKCKAIVIEFAEFPFYCVFTFDVNLCWLYNQPAINTRCCLIRKMHKSGFTEYFKINYY